MRKTKILRVTPADKNNQVVTVSSEYDEAKFHHQTKPCKECPWKKDSTVGAFPAEAYRISAHTAYDMSSHTFACHMSGTASPKTCAGFLLRGAYHNMSVRMAVINNRLDLHCLVDDDRVVLYDSYREMAEANGVDPDDPVLAPCR